MSYLYFVAYAIPYLWCWREVARRFAWDGTYGGSRPGKADYAMGMLMGAICAIFWPVVIPVILVVDRERIVEAILGVPEDVKARDRELELREREREVERLERELGIGKTKAA